jgi:hypothetical protein
MRRARSLASAAAILSSAWLASPAHAQSVQTQSSALHPPPSEYEPIGIRSGNLILYPDLFAGVAYDDNIYAEPTNTKSDEIFELVPQVRAQAGQGAWNFRALGLADIRRYAKHHSENSVGAIVQGEATFTPRDNESFHVLAGWQRRVEDRGDPEANPGIGVGPRIASVFNGQIDYHRARGQWLVDAVANVTRSNYLAAEDLYRDHTSVGGQLTAGRLVGGLTFATVTAFVEHRSFDRKIDLSGFDRDATTYGARAGIQISPGGLLEGSASIGVFHFDPVDKQIDPYTGLSISADLIYRPTERTSVLLDAFRGNVATYRTGAKSRTDTRFGVTIQQEIHHDLFAHLTGYVRDSKYRGGGLTETTYLAEGGIEYLVNRNVVIGALDRYGKRTSNDPLHEFERNRAMAYVRLRF